MSRFQRLYRSTHNKTRLFFFALTSITILLSACDSDKQATPTTPEDTPSTLSDNAPERDYSVTDDSGEASEMAQFSLVDLAIANVEPTKNYNAAGTVRFYPSEDRDVMVVEIDISGVEPGKHGFHIHEIGDCSAEDASSAGGHFNPYQKDHGSRDDVERHLGDLGNVEADDLGEIKAQLEFEGLAFSGPANILHKAVVIHEEADDLTTDPAGDAGNRIGCGVIQRNPDVLADPQ
ncbi:superoxide dismutase family protein [Pseudomaricurvus sp.]|uniref:superoxide dismutase family protein n=1 Tax=Pseudomaricurvus sp. TaxID=2004510 RepID=UPI003F6AC5B9